jgi:hypothetical protein
MSIAAGLIRRTLSHDFHSVTVSATLHSATEKSHQPLPIARLWLPYIQLGNLVSVAESASTMK